ncbi:MAG: RNA methyltransferase [Pirellulaceae bacterium]
MLDSDYEVRSVLIDLKHAERYSTWADTDVEVLAVASSEMVELTGFDFHRGVLACGQRRPLRSLREGFSRTFPSDETMVGLIGIHDPENLGGILRSCGALGVRRVVLGGGTCDPFSRRALRVAMGATFRLEIYYSHQMQQEIEWLSTSADIDCIATSLDGDAQPLSTASRSGPCLLLLGNERDGLPGEIQACVTRKLRIPMQLGIDSLNVSAAAAIFIHHFCSVATRPGS